MHPGNFYLCLFSRSGYDGLIKSLMSELPPDLVTYNRPVRCVHWNNAGNGGSTMKVECDDGERIAADHVILTVPLGRSCTLLVLLFNSVHGIL